MRILRTGLTPILLLTGLLFAGNALGQNENALTLEIALQRVLAANPEIQAGDLAIRSGKAWAEQAALRPNPELGIEWENVAGTGELSGIDASEVTVAASQTFELGGKRSRRTDLARSEADLVSWDSRSLRLDLIEATQSAFLDAWAAQEEWRLAVEASQLDSHLLEELQIRHEAGAASPIDLNRARVVLASSRIFERQQEQGFTAAGRQLAALWSSREPDFDRIDASFDQVTDPQTESLPADWKLRNPDVARWTAERATRRAELALAESIGTPDLDLGVGIRRETGSGDVAFVLEAGLPLPLFDRNEPAIRATGHELERSEKLAEAVVAAVGSELDIAVEERAAAFAEIHILREEVLPQAAEAHSATESGHVRGLFSLTDVLETRRSLFELNHTLLESIVRYHAAGIRIDRLTGGREYPGSSQPVEVVE